MSKADDRRRPCSHRCECPGRGLLIAACLAGFCLPLAQPETACASHEASAAQGIPFLVEQRRAILEDHAFLDELASREHWDPSSLVIQGPDDEPPPASAPLPPALLPAAGVLGWAILRNRRRRV